jgi:glycosyltransferase A (GT-A) superfamily protein (DUF2064 family)
MIVLVVAKAPVAGEAKTRLVPALGPQGSADLAAAALLDTLEVAADAARELGGPAARPVVAFTGDVTAAARAVEVRSALDRCVVIPQRGDGFAERLVHAHQDAAVHGAPVLQIGMDTPQVTIDLLIRSAAALSGCDAVLGPAEDGGWWLLGVRVPAAAAPLAGVPMSTPRTGRLTLEALRGKGFRTSIGPGLRDVDTIDDARAVAATAPGTRFAAALERVLLRPRPEQQVRA